MQVQADFASLKRVIIHHPDDGIEKVTPSNTDYLLYDEIVYLPQMQAEHQVFIDIIEAFIGGENVLELEDLLGDVLENPETREAIIKAVVQFHELLEGQGNKLSGLSANPLAHALITGYEEEGEVILPPLPNLIFTRDIGVMIEDHLLTCHARKMPRKRENILTWFVLHHHPLFKDFQESGRWIDLSNSEKEVVENLVNGEASVEGGDVMMLSPRHLMIAESDRTNRAGIDKVKELLFQKDVIDKLSVVSIPKEGYCMHIDTIFSKLDEHDYVVFSKVLFDEQQVQVVDYDRDGEIHSFSTLKEMVLDEDPNARFALCGGGAYPSDEREQWTSACNFVTLKPGVALCYDRNSKTITALQEMGYKVFKAHFLIEAFDHGIITPQDVQKTIITIPAGELSRAGGGPHCLTFPLWRG